MRISYFKTRTSSGLNTDRETRQVRIGGGGGQVNNYGGDDFFSLVLKCKFLLVRH